MKDLWEYNVVKARGIIPLASLNKLGAEGWEMVSTATIDSDFILIYFKRRLS